MSPPRRRQAFVLSLVGLYLAIQIVVPLRHHLYPGKVSWTEEGHTFAWRMLLRTKRGEGEFLVRAFDPMTASWLGQTWTDLDLPPRHRGRIWTRPDMTLEYSHHIAARLREQGYERIDIRAHAEVSLNARPPQLLIDPEVNLVEQKLSLRPASWILPLKE